jgi:hypothetical protein
VGEKDDEVVLWMWMGKAKADIGFSDSESCGEHFDAALSRVTAPLSDYPDRTATALLPLLPHCYALETLPTWKVEVRRCEYYSCIFVVAIIPLTRGFPLQTTIIVSLRRNPK